MAMGFLTGLHVLKCDRCGNSLVSGATGDSHPYSDYSCECGWSGTLCDDCGKRGCPSCKKPVESTYQRIKRLSGSDIMF